MLMNAKQNGNTFTQELSSVHFKSKVFPLTSDSMMNFTFEDIRLDLSVAALGFESNRSTRNEIPSTAVVVKNLTQYFISDDLVFNSDALSLLVKNRQHINLVGGHTLSFVSKNANYRQFKDKPDCVFWDFTNSTWHNTGCRPNSILSNRSHTTCECDHLTNFASLLDISNREGPSIAKSVLTYTCSSLSCIFITMAAYASMKLNKESYSQYDYKFKVRSNKASINKTIYIWLFLSHILIMFGMDLTNHQGLCIFSSLLLLFCLLTTFSFMLILCIHLYITLSEQYILRFSRIVPFLIAGYSIPLVIILVSFILIYFVELGDFNLALTSLTGEYL